LGVSVEYLVTCADNGKDRPLSSFHRDIQEIVLAAERLSKKDRSIILNLALLMKDR
jgi:hypothetical protein